MSKMRKRSGGFSLVEVVIAISVIVIVSVAAMTIILSTIAAKAKAVTETEAQNFADNVLECFKVSETDEEFKEYMLFAKGVSLGNGELGAEGTAYTYRAQKDRFIADITVNFPQNARSKLVIEVTDKDGDSIVSFTYTGSYREGNGI